MNPWETIKQQLETAVSPQSFRDWINRTSFGQLDGGVLSVHVPNRETKTWLETEFCSHVDSIIRRLQLPVQSVLYQLAAASGESAVVMQSDQEFGLESPFSQLNPKFTFDSFVVGACNQFAHAAARSVATNPSRSYNPLFIYGGVGMGKTHLLHAIGHAMLAEHPSLRLLFTSSERFMNEMITCIRLERMSYFHQRYRSADVLLVDDIQLLGNKERTQ